MPWPATALPVVVEIAPGAAPAGDPSGAAFVDFTTSARIADGITIEEGRGDWGADVDPGKCGLTFNNPNGDLSEHNPLGAYYGLLGKDTPLRVRLRRAEDAFGRTVSPGWGTSDSGQVWTTSGTSHSVSGGQGLQSHATVNTLRWALLDVNLLDVEQLVDVTVPALLTGAALVVGLTFRAVDADNCYFLRAEFNAGGTSLQLKLVKRVATVESQLANLNPHPTVTYAAGVPMRVRASVAGNRLAMKVWPAANPEPGAWDVQVTDSTYTAPGKAGIQSFLVPGNTNALPFTPAYDNYKLHVDLSGGFVPAWVPRSDLSGKVRTVPVLARGGLSRLKPASGKPPVRSPLRRTIGGNGPLAYWPGEDGVASGQVASAVPGGQPMTVSGPVAFVPTDELNFAAADPALKYGSLSLVDLSAGASLSATVPGSVTTATATRWTVQVVGQVSVASASGDVVLLEWATPGGTFVRWQLVWVKSAVTIRVLAFNASGTPTTVINLGSVSAFFDSRDVSAVQNGGNIDVGYAWVESGAAFVATASVAGTLAGITSVSVNPTKATVAAPEQLPAGHVAVYDTTHLPAQRDISDAVLSYDGAAGLGVRLEAAHDRLARLAAEDGIPVTVPAVSDSALAVLMGAQPAGVPLDLYRQCEESDGGVLFERPFALAYKPRASLYNQTAALALNSGDLSAAPEPDGTGQRYRNQVTAKRVDGSSAIAQADEVAAAGAIVYDESVDLSLATDAPLLDHAGWRMHLASTTGLRWPRLEINFQEAPELLDAWLNCRIGSRITVANPPADVAGQGIDVLLEGYTLTLGYKAFQVVANCSPAPLWDVATVDGPQRVAADGSTLAASLALGAMSLSLASTALNGVWTTDPADFPLDLRVGGERVTVSAISGASSPQTATITARSVNGVTKAWPSGTEVDVWQPAVAAL